MRINTCVGSRLQLSSVQELAGPQWWLDRKGEVPAGKKPYFRLPIFNYHKVRQGQTASCSWLGGCLQTRAVSLPECTGDHLTASEIVFSCSWCILRMSLLSCHDSNHDLCSLTYCAKPLNRKRTLVFFGGNPYVVSLCRVGHLVVCFSDTCYQLAHRHKDVLVSYLMCVLSMSVLC